MIDNPSRSPTFPQVLSTAIRQGLEEVHTNMPGRVESYDEVRQLVDVQPLVDQQVLEEDGTTTSISYPVIRNVPVVFPGANGFRLTLPLVKGDEVSLSFTECSLEVWKANGGQVNPGDARRFHISDAICTPGLHSNKTPWTGASKTAATFGKDGGPQVVWRASTIELGGDDQNAPVEAGVLGTTQKTDLDSMLQSGATACTAGATACATAATALDVVTTAITAAATPLSVAPLTPVGTLFATVGTGLAALSAQLTALGSQLTNLSNAFTTLRTALPNHVSGIVKLK